MNIEEECCACGDPDYGVFGDQTSCQCPCHHPAIYEPNPRQEADVTRQRERQERIARTSREFNSSLIQLYNDRRRT